MGGDIGIPEGGTKHKTTVRKFNTVRSLYSEERRCELRQCNCKLNPRGIPVILEQDNSPTFLV